MSPDEVTLPVQFNLWKHHAGFLGKKIIQAKNEGPARLLPYIKLIGNAQMDMYTGTLPPFTIAAEILEKIRAENLKNYEDYRCWLNNTPKKYRLLDLSDGSTWTMLLGFDKEKYVHIHPARYSKYSLRVRGLTLKTAITVLIFAEGNMEQAMELNLVNKIRTELLNEPPLKRVNSEKGVGKIISLLCQTIEVQT